MVSKTNKTIAPAWLLAFVPLLLAPGSVMATGIFYCCQDASDKQICSDILPRECYGKVYREIGSNGRTLRIIKPPPPPLSQEELARQEAEEIKKREAERIALEQKRKDDALLNTYGSVRDIDAMRERALGDTGKEIKAAQEHIVTLEGKRVAHAEEAEKYIQAGEEVPAQTQQAIEKIDAQIEIQEQFIEQKKKDTASITAKYNEEKQRYIELSRQGNRKQLH